MENEYIDYQYYLYYELANFVREKNIEFDLQFVKNNVDDFDIIFGEWDKISKLSLYEISLPSKIKDFYQNNGIKINNNVLPLDLDTFILLSNQNYSLESLEGLSNFYSPIKYTFGMNFNDNNLIKLISFISHQDIEELNSNTFESAISSFKKLYQNSNKNILNSDLTEIYNSYESKENLFTLFSDGVLLYKNLRNNFFNLFPQSKYIWNEELGIFKNHKNHIPYSFFGFSAYINNKKQIGLLCHFVKKEVRFNTFKNFNIQISPLSINELNYFKNLPDGYEEIVNMKNKYVLSDNNKLDNENINIIKDIIFGDNTFQNLIKTNSLLN